MMLDLGGIFGDGGGDEGITEPRAIFTTLNRDPRFKRPSDEQGEVLDQWFDRRAESDLTIKMNTGAGKTLVGLLMLMSSIREKKGPAVYITPDNYLAKQVIKEARALGIQVTENTDDPFFLRGESILVTNARKLVNGKSVFGVNTLEIPIGTIVIDDAHACLDDIKEQFTISLANSHSVTKEILANIGGGIRNYNPILYSRIEQDDPSASIEVPYWIWKDNKRQIAEALLKARDDKELLFKLPLIFPVLDFCQCVVTGKDITFAPRFLPIDCIPSFTQADRRIYMTATLANDGILVSHLKANVDAIERPIRPKGVGDMGVRMILAPMELNTEFTFEDLKKVAKLVATMKNVVVITPSNKAAKRWSEITDQFLDKDNIYDGVERLRSGHVGLTVMANKYDGIDLPFSACELLILDGMPESDGEIDKINSLALEGTKSSRINAVQKIEQGMGRGVRSGEDFCAVLLWGPKLTRTINIPQSFEHFTEATKIQLEIARRLTKQVTQGQPNIGPRELLKILSYSIDKNIEWRNGSKTALAKARPVKSAFVEDFLPKAREAFDFARRGTFDRACELIEIAANDELEPRTQGFILCQLAEYMYHRDVVNSFNILQRASKLNPSIVKPFEGLEYRRLNAPQNQAVASCKFMERFVSGDDLILWFRDLESDLTFDVKTTKRFEAAIRELGLWLGFGSHRPEDDTRKGPDNLWAVGDNSYFVIECKSGSVSQEISKSDVDQLSGSMNWFREKYPPDAKGIPVIIHPSRSCGTQATPPEFARVIDSERFSALLETLVTFAKAIASGPHFDNPTAVRERIVHFGLSSQELLNRFSRELRSR